MPTLPVMRRDVGTGAGSGSAAPGGAGWLSLAAAPTFALMALWTGLANQPDMLCMQSASAIGGMTTMYLLMSVFHLTPWLRLLRRAGCAIGT